MKRLYSFVLLNFFASFTLISLEEGHLKSTIKTFDTYAEAQMKAWKVPGMSIGIVKDQEVIFIKGYGQRGINDTRPVDENTIFQIGSLTKGFTAALVATSVDKKELNWEDKVIDLLPTFRLEDPWVTTQFQIEDLLAQRSGLPPYAGDTQSLLGYSQDEILEHLHFIKPISSFRSKFGYQNVFFLVAARVLELKKGLSYEQLLKQELFSPLEMKDTTTTLKDYLKTENHAEFHYAKADGTLIQPSNDKTVDLNWTYTLGPAGGINSTIKDMTKWMILQANQGKYKDKQLISADSMQRMGRPHVFAAEFQNMGMYYGLGWIRMDYSPHPIIWHDGGTLGVYNVGAFIPQEKLGIIILTNMRGHQLPLALALEFFDLYYKKEDLNWSQKLLKEMKPNPASEVLKETFPAMPLVNYAGVYHNVIYGDVKVEAIAEGLTLEIGKIPTKLTMKHWDRDIFILQWPIMEEKGNESKVTFLLNEEGKIDKMNIDLFVKEGSGIFEKKKS